MWINNKKDLREFEETLDKCSADVYLVSADGKSYDLNDPLQRVTGPTRMLNVRDENEEPEVFARNTRDTMLLFEFLKSRKAA